MTSPLLPGAEPWSHVGGPAGALCLHGFTGNPTSMRPVAEALASAGFSVELPRLPGHGTTVDEMIPTRWEDWSRAAEAALESLTARAAPVVVAGLSMGGSLTAWLGTRHPELAGLAFVNPAILPQAAEVVEMIEGMLGEGTTTLPAIGGDIADPDVKESAYEETPLAPLLSLNGALDSLQHELGRIACPILIATSPQDHVVETVSSDVLAASVTGPVERISLERSYHVATLDYDRAFLCERIVEFARRVTAPR